MSALTGSWAPQPAAEALLGQALAEALGRSPRLQSLADRLRAACGVRLRDLVDHLALDDTARRDFAAVGWSRTGSGVLEHHQGHFPAIIDGASGRVRVVLRVENLEELLHALDLDAEIRGEPRAPLRMAQLFSEGTVDVGAVERNGGPGFEVTRVDDGLLTAATIHAQLFALRRRGFPTTEQGFEHVEFLVRSAVDDLGPHLACHLFFAAERQTWAASCTAATVQEGRQRTAGIGWANVDHHTFDSSRPWFRRTVALLELLGYQCRELFYAGDQAGWGSQILEQPVLRSTIFADIDLAPHEVDIDFAHMDLEPLDRHRRAGLWCALHGESVLEGGLNHVAGLYDQRLLRAQLVERGITMMAPFSDLPHLYQELTVGQLRPVDPARVDQLELEGHIDAGSAARFRAVGALATHLENLERNDGFKGFNQPGIDGVLRVIDPRREAVEAVAAGT